MDRPKAPVVPVQSTQGDVAAAVYLDVRALRKNPRNPRLHGDECLRDSGKRRHLGRWPAHGSRQNRSERVGLDLSSVNHCMMVRAESDYVVEVVGSALCAWRDVVDVQSEREAADATRTPVTLEGFASAVGIGSGHCVREPAGNGEFSAHRFPANRRAVHAPTAFQLTWPRHDRFPTRRAVRRNAHVRVWVLAFPSVVTPERAESTSRTSGIPRLSLLRLAAPFARDDHGREFARTRSAGHVMVRDVPLVLAAVHGRGLSAPTQALPCLDVRAHLSLAASNVRRTHCDTGRPSRAAAFAKRSASATVSRMLRFFDLEDFDLSMRQRNANVNTWQRVAA